MAKCFSPRHEPRLPRNSGNYRRVETPPDLENAKKEKRDFRTIDADPENHALLSPRKSIQPASARRNYHVEGFDWSPDSRFIAFEHWPGPLADNWTKADISEVEVETGKVKTLAATGASETSPHYSPDGRYLAFSRSADPPRWAGDERIVLLSRSDGTSRALPPTFDETPNLIGWSGDSTWIIFSETIRTRATLFAMPMDGQPKTLYEPERGAVGSGALNWTGTQVGFSRESPQEPPEAFLLNSNGLTKPVRVGRANFGYELYNVLKSSWPPGRPMVGGRGVRRGPGGPPHGAPQ